MNHSVWLVLFISFAVCVCLLCHKYAVVDHHTALRECLFNITVSDGCKAGDNYTGQSVRNLKQKNINRFLVQWTAFSNAANF